MDTKSFHLRRASASEGILKGVSLKGEFHEPGVDKGAILEKGNHDELMAEKGEYYRLYMSQYDFLKAQ